MYLASVTSFGIGDGQSSWANSNPTFEVDMPVLGQVDGLHIYRRGLLSIFPVLPLVKGSGARSRHAIGDTVFA